MTVRTLMSALALGAVTALPVSALTPQHAEKCQAMAQSIEAKTAQVKAASSERDALAKIAETKGEAWEEVEVHRLVSAGHADAADAAKAEYEAARQAFARAEMALRGQVRMHEQNVASFNAQCATN